MYILSDFQHLGMINTNAVNYVMPFLIGQLQILAGINFMIMPSISLHMQKQYNALVYLV